MTVEVATAYVLGEAGRLSEQARAAIAAAGHLVIDVELLAGETDPWTDAHLPGLDRGCALRPGSGPRHVEVATDRGGIFFTAVIDLVLRGHAVGSLVLVGEFPPAFLRLVEGFAATKGYGIGRVGGEPHPDPETVVLPARPASLAERVAPGRVALVLIDVQNDFCAPDGATGRTGAPMEMIFAATERIRRLLAEARAAGLLVVHVRAEYGRLYRHVGAPYRFPAPGGREPAVWTESAAALDSPKRFPDADVEVCRPGSWGGAFVDGIDPRPGEAVVTKHRFGAFTDTGLDLLLRSRGIDTVILAGVTTNCCVETSAREAVMRDFYLVVASDCVAVKDHLRDLHDATLESLGLYFGLVRTADEIAGYWDSAATLAPGHRMAGGL